MKLMRFLFAVIILGLVLVSCQNEDSRTVNESYPIEEPDLANESAIQEDINENVVPVDSQEAYPSDEALSYPSPNSGSANAEQAYPYPTRELDEGKRFSLDEPLTPSMTTITGTGPAGISIRLVSVSNVGESLAFGVIDENGEFELALSRELETQEAIAIMLGDESQIPQFLDAPGATDIPMLGFILDMVATTSSGN